MGPGSPQLGWPAGHSRKNSTYLQVPAQPPCPCFQPCLPSHRLPLPLAAPHLPPTTRGPPFVLAAQPGDELFLRCSHTDVRMGVWRLEPVHHTQASRLRRMQVATGTQRACCPLACRACKVPAFLPTQIQGACPTAPAGVAAAPGEPAVIPVSTA